MTLSKKQKIFSLWLKLSTLTLWNPKHRSKSGNRDTAPHIHFSFFQVQEGSRLRQKLEEILSFHRFMRFNFSQQYNSSVNSRNFRKFLRRTKPCYRPGKRDPRSSSFPSSQNLCLRKSIEVFTGPKNDPIDVWVTELSTKAGTNHGTQGKNGFSSTFGNACNKKRKIHANTVYARLCEKSCVLASSFEISHLFFLMCEWST